MLTWRKSLLGEIKKIATDFRQWNRFSLSGPVGQPAKCSQYPGVGQFSITIGDFGLRGVLPDKSFKTRFYSMDSFALQPRLLGVSERVYFAQYGGPLLASRIGVDKHALITRLWSSAFDVELT